MSNLNAWSDNRIMGESNVELVRRGFEAAARGDLDAVAALLDEDVYWGAEGGGGCHDRKQALRWMRQAIAGGLTVAPLEARELPDGRMLIVLQRSGSDEAEPAPPHAQLVSFRDGKISEILVYPTAEDALSAAGAA